MKPASPMEPEYREEEAPTLRRIIAQRMTESKVSNPHFYLTMDVDVENLIRRRTELIESYGRKISYNDILIKAIANTFDAHPECNASYVDDKIRYYDEVNICVAVAVKNGLLTPTIRDCGKKDIGEINEISTELIDRARNMRLRPREGMGGTFTLSNLGMLGVEEFSAIINPPQSMILAVGSVREVPVVKDGQIVVGKRMKMTLSCDHKIVDGATGAVFLGDLKSALEAPESLR